MPGSNVRDGFLGNRVFICDRKKHFKNVCENLPSHAGSEAFADAHLHCFVNTVNSGVQFSEPIPVQRSMFSAVSPFFATIFTEAEKSRPGHDVDVLLEDTNAANMWRLVQLLYKGWNAVSEKQRIEVMALCARFDIKIKLAVDGNPSSVAKAPKTPKAKESKKPDKTPGEKGKPNLTSTLASPTKAQLPVQQQHATPSKNPIKQPKSSTTTDTKDSKKRKMSTSEAATSSASTADSPKKTKKETPAKKAKKLFSETKNFTSPLRKCPHCETVTFNEDNFKAHLATHKKEKKLKKEKTSSEEKPNEKLDTTVESKSPKKAAAASRCFFCSNTYAKSTSSLPRHVVLNHFKAQVEQSMPADTLQCPECTYLAPNRPTLVVHVGLTHKKVYGFCTAEQMKGIPIKDAQASVTNSAKKKPEKKKKQEKQAPPPTPPTPANGDGSDQEEEEDEDEDNDESNEAQTKGESSFANVSKKQDSSSSSEEDSEDDD